MDTNSTPIINTDDVRGLIVGSLNLGHLSKDDQDTVIGRLSEALLERASLAVMDRLSEEQLDHFDQLIESKQMAEAQIYVKSIIPDFDNFVSETVGGAIEEYKRLVNEEAAKSGQVAQ